MLNHHTYMSTTAITTSTDSNSTGGMSHPFRAIMSLFSPSQLSLKTRVLRINVQLLYPDIPTPPAYRWMVDENGKLEYNLTEGNILLQEFIYILCMKMPSTQTKIRNMNKWPAQRTPSTKTELLKSTQLH